MSKKPYRWAAPGDVNAFFGLMLDNIADLLLTVGLLSAVFGFPTIVALRYMVPGTAIGVLVGDLLFFWMAIKVARRSGRHDITAMPLGLDTPSTFGMVFFVLGPAFLAAKASGYSEHEAAIYTWQIGICSIFISGLFKFVCAFGSNWIRQVVPRAGLLGSLAAIALVLISFLPLLEVLHHPVVGLMALAIILTTLVAKVRFPFRVPAALAALLVAGAVYYLMMATGLLHGAPDMKHELANARQGLLPYEWFSVFSFEWTAVLGDAVHYLPIVIPFALATVIGGIDCTESAAAAGDEFDTGLVIGVEAFSTLVASLCGGVIQTTPYIGHPAYKAMGGRAAYTLATAIFVGGAGLLGYFAYLYVLIPKPTVFPILIFVGLEISAQSFFATPRRHYTAVALACMPALAALAMMFVGKVMSDPAVFGLDWSIESLAGGPIKFELTTLRILANGFIVTSLLWAAALASITDRRLLTAASYFSLAAGCTLFGVIHSPFKAGNMFLPWQLASADQELVLRYTCGYLLVAILMIAWGFWQTRQAGASMCSWERDDGA